MRRPLGLTVSRHILDSQRLHPDASGELSGLLNELIVVCKTISAEVNMAGLAAIIGLSGKKNVQDEEVQKLDEFAHLTLVNRMARCGYLCVMSSEEEEEVIEVEPNFEGNYVLAFDPLDGSSNIDVNVSIGSIFSIHKRRSTSGPGSSADLLQPGHAQVAAGYVLYGSSTMLVLTTGDGVHGFTLDPNVGEFYLSHANIKVPERSTYLSINEGNKQSWLPQVQAFFEMLTQQDEEKQRPYSSRYIGSLVADFHRNLLSGGLFAYPRNTKDPELFQGKLRLLYEAAPLAMIIEQAGGRAITDDGRNILDIEPESLHQRVPLIIGSKLDVDDAEEYFTR